MAIGLELADIKNLHPELLEALSEYAVGRENFFGTIRDAFNPAVILGAWEGTVANRAAAKFGTMQTITDSHVQSYNELSTIAEKHINPMRTLRHDLRHIITMADGAGVVIDYRKSTAQRKTSFTRASDVIAIQKQINTLINCASQLDSAISQDLLHLKSDYMSEPPKLIPGLDAESAKKFNQESAERFRQLTGHYPRTNNEWITARYLNPKNTTDRDHGADSSVIVGRIRPVPGKGLVRINAYIPIGAVNNPLGLGSDKLIPKNIVDRRGANPNPTMGTDSSRVSIVIDYDTGLVIMRQNPTVVVDTGAAKAGEPRMKIAQGPDGTVRIQYCAADTFQLPGTKNLANVQGDFTIKPNGPEFSLGGRVTGYPSLEIYHDHDNNEGITTLFDYRTPNTSPWGPTLNLPTMTLSLGNEAYLHVRGDDQYSYGTQKREEVDFNPFANYNLGGEGGESAQLTSLDPDSDPTIIQSVP